MISPKMFAENLKKSNLSLKSRQAILKLMPKLEMADIFEINSLFKKNIHNSQNLLKRAQIKKNIVINNFKKKLKIFK